MALRMIAIYLHGGRHKLKMSLTYVDTMIAECHRRLLLFTNLASLRPRRSRFRPE